MTDVMIALLAVILVWLAVLTAAVRRKPRAVLVPGSMPLPDTVRVAGTANGQPWTSDLVRAVWTAVLPWNGAAECKAHFDLPAGVELTECVFDDKHRLPLDSPAGPFVERTDYTLYATLRGPTRMFATTQRSAS